MTKEEGLARLIEDGWKADKAAAALDLWDEEIAAGAPVEKIVDILLYIRAEMTPISVFPPRDIE